MWGLYCGYPAAGSVRQLPSAGQPSQCPLPTFKGWGPRRDRGHWEGLQGPSASTELLRSISQLARCISQRIVYRRKTFFFLIVRKCYSLGMKTCVKETASLGCGDTSLMTCKPASSGWNPNLENQRTRRSLENAWGMLGPWGSFSPRCTCSVLCCQRLG